MNRDDAEEYTQALGQVVAGGWRQVALGKRLGVPEALGISTEEWVEDRLGGYIRLSIPERREAVAELMEEGLSTREIGDVLGVDHSTVVRDQKADGADAPVDPPTSLGPAASTKADGADAPSQSHPAPESRTKLAEANTNLDLLPAPSDEELRLPSGDEIKQAVGTALPGSLAPSSAALTTWDARLKAASDIAAAIRELPAYPLDGDSSLDLAARAVARALGDAATRLLQALPEERTMRRIK